MKVIHQVLGVIFAILLAFQLVYAAGHGFGTHNGIGTALWMAILSGLIGLFTVNIVRIITSSGATLMVSKEEMANAFFFAAFIVGILTSIQVLLTLSGNKLVFIPTTLETILDVLAVGGLIAWIVLAGIFLAIEAFGAFSTAMTQQYAWIAVAVVIVVGFLFYFAFRDANTFSFSQEDALFTATKQEVTVKPEKEPDATKIADNSKGSGKQPSEAEKYKETEQVIRDGNGVTVSQKRNADGSVEQHIDADEPDGH